MHKICDYKKDYARQDKEAPSSLISPSAQDDSGFNDGQDDSINILNNSGKLLKIDDYISPNSWRYKYRKTQVKNWRFSKKSMLRDIILKD